MAVVMAKGEGRKGSSFFQYVNHNIMNAFPSPLELDARIFSVDYSQH
jgi:hypothetical protein